MATQSVTIGTGIGACCCEDPCNCAEGLDRTNPGCADPNSEAYFGGCNNDAFCDDGRVGTCALMTCLSCPSTFAWYIITEIACVGYDPGPPEEVLGACIQTGDFCGCFA